MKTENKVKKIKVKKYIRYEKDSNGFPVKVICYKFNCGTLYPGDGLIMDCEIIFDKETHNRVGINLKNFRVDKRKLKFNTIPEITNVVKWHNMNEN